MRETYDALLLHDVMQLLHTCLVQSCTRISVTYVGLYIKEGTRPVSYTHLTLPTILRV